MELASETRPPALDALRRVEDERLSFDTRIVIDGIPWRIHKGAIQVLSDLSDGDHTIGSIPATAFPRLSLAYTLQTPERPRGYKGRYWHRIGGANGISVTAREYGRDIRYRGRYHRRLYPSTEGYYARAENLALLASVLFGLGGWGGALPTGRAGVRNPTRHNVPDVTWDPTRCGITLSEY